MTNNFEINTVYSDLLSKVHYQKIFLPPPPYFAFLEISINLKEQQGVRGNNSEYTLSGLIPLLLRNVCFL